MADIVADLQMYSCVHYSDVPMLSVSDRSITMLYSIVLFSTLFYFTVMWRGFLSCPALKTPCRYEQVAVDSGYTPLLSADFVHYALLRAHAENIGCHLD